MKKQVPYKIKAYYMHNEVDVFTYTRVLKTNVPELDLDIRNEFSGLWVERVFMKTQNKLPGVSRRSGVGGIYATRNLTYLYRSTMKLFKW